MKITTTDIQKFHKLYFQAVGISLSDDEARRKLSKLLRQVEILVSEESKKLRLRQSNGEIRYSDSK